MYDIKINLKNNIKKRFMKVRHQSTSTPTPWVLISPGRHEPSVKHLVITELILQ